MTNLKPTFFSSLSTTSKFLPAPPLAPHAISKSKDQSHAPNDHNESPQQRQRILFDIVDATKASTKLAYAAIASSRQFQKTLQLLAGIQGDRQLTDRRDSRAGIMELCKRKGLPWTPPNDGFVFSLEYVEKYYSASCFKTTTATPNTLASRAARQSRSQTLKISPSPIPASG